MSFVAFIVLDAYVQTRAFKVEFATLSLDADGRPVYHPFSDSEMAALLKEENIGTAPAGATAAV